MASQDEISVEKNKSWFSGNAAYADSVASMDTYQRLREAMNGKLGACGETIDIGNGGVFDYDTTLASSIVAVDLFLDEIDTSAAPANVRFVRGSALDLPIEDASFDTVVIVMLLHHLIGTNVERSLSNVRTSLRECARVLRPGGRLVLAESCVPAWFYAFEKLVFRPVGFVVNLTIKHPMTLQYPTHLIRREIEACGLRAEVTRVPKGDRVLQFGFSVPSWVTPVQAEIFTATKSR